MITLVAKIKAKQGSEKALENALIRLIEKVETEGEKKKIAVFSSGGPISIVAQIVLGLSGPKTLDLLWQVVNASVTRLKYGGGNITLSGFNDIAHLELTGDKTLLTYR